MSLALVNEYSILLVALLLITGVVATKFSTKVGVPSLVLFLIIGMIIGSDGLGLIYFDNPVQAQLIGIFALIVIIFEGGLQTKWSNVKTVIPTSLSLSTLGVLFTTIIVGLASKLILRVSWIEGFLFGSIVSSTDAAAVFTVLKGKNISPRIASTLEVESGSNDPMAVFLTIASLQLITVDKPNLLMLIGTFFWQMFIGLLTGYILGKLAIKCINKINLESSGLYPVFSLSLALLTYSLTALIGASGLLAVYIAAIVVGNSELPYQHSIFKFNEGFAWMMQILMFMILGLFVFPTQLLRSGIFFNGFLLSIVLIFVARPAAVFISLIKSKYTKKEKLFLSWAGLKGAVPIVLATYPMIAQLENSQLFFNVIFFVVLSSALIQGSTIITLANKLNLTGPKRVDPPHSIELVSIGKANAEMVEFEVNEQMFIAGKQIKDLSFPKDVLVTAIVRDGYLVTPTGSTVVEVEDFLYILVSKDRKKELMQLIDS